MHWKCNGVVVGDGTNVLRTTCPSVLKEWSPLWRLYASSPEVYAFSPFVALCTAGGPIRGCIFDAKNTAEDGTKEVVWNKEKRRRLKCTAGGPDASLQPWNEAKRTGERTSEAYRRQRGLYSFKTLGYSLRASTTPPLHMQWCHPSFVVRKYDEGSATKCIFRNAHAPFLHRVHLSLFVPDGTTVLCIFFFTMHLHQRCMCKEDVQPSVYRIPFASSMHWDQVHFKDSIRCKQMYNLLLSSLFVPDGTTAGASCALCKCKENLIRSKEAYRGWDHVSLPHLEKVHCMCNGGVALVGSETDPFFGAKTSEALFSEWNVELR